MTTLEAGVGDDADAGNIRVRGCIRGSCNNANILLLMGLCLQAVGGVGAGTAPGELLLSAGRGAFPSLPWAAAAPAHQLCAFFSF